MPTLKWIGGGGHVSDTYGVLEDGKTYDMSDEQAKACLQSPESWEMVKETNDGKARARNQGRD